MKGFDVASYLTIAGLLVMLAIATIGDYRTAAHYGKLCEAAGGIPNLITDEPRLCLLENGTFLLLDK